MPRSLKTPAVQSKNRTDKSIGKSRRSHRWFEPVIAEFREIFGGKKLAEHLASRAGRHQRVAEIWLEGRGSPNGDALARLIRSDVGQRVLMALIADVQHPWAKGVRAEHEIAKIRKRRAEDESRLQALERGFSS